MRVVHVLTVADSLVFFAGQPAWFRERGVDVAFVATPDPRLDRFGARWGVPVHPIPIPRRVAPLEDLRAIVRLVRLFRRMRPDVVHGHTPKGGLLGMLAAALAGVPVRVYHIHGLPFVTARGPLRAVLAATERVSCLAANHVLCVSRGVREVALAEGLTHKPIEVLLGGSINGVDARGRFDPAAHAARRGPERDRLGIPADAVVFLFVGRLVRDKGVVELAEAWGRVRAEVPGAHLVVAGPFEERDPVPAATRRALEGDDRVHLLGFLEDVERVYAMSDLVVLPTYREGFPVVPLEAAAMGLPVLTTAIPGCTEAVVDGVTGTLVPPADAGRLADAMRAYGRDPDLRRRHGDSGRARVLSDYVQEDVWRALLERYLAWSERPSPAAAPTPEPA